MIEKIKGLVIGTIIIISSLSIVMISDKIYVQADEEFSLNTENSLNSTYIYDVTLDLSRTIFYHKYGRWFGSDGENSTKRDIRDWMNESNLTTSVEQVSSGTSQEFKKSNRLMNFSDDLQVNTNQLTIYISSNNTYMNITDFYIHPRWNESILEFLFPRFEYNEDKLTNVFEEKNLQIKPRPSGLSRILNFIFINHSSDILSNEEIMSGNKSALTKSLLEWFEDDNNVSFEDILANPENASLIPGFTEDTYSNRCDYVFIGEDMAFNPIYNHTYWDGWYEFMDFLFSHTSNFFFPKIHNLVTECRDQKQRIEMFLWSFCPFFKGLVLYDHNNDTFDMCYNSYFSRPTIFINRSVGLDIVHNLDDHSLNYTLDQKWNTNVESYNVIGQLNVPDTNNPNEYILIGCLYDGWNNQASADSAIGMGVLLAIARYFNDHHITPKTNIRFVAFSGEEAGGRGAFSYEKEHKNDAIPLIIDLNQFGYSQASPRQALWIFSNNATENVTLHVIADDTNFITRVNNATDLHNLNVSSEPYFSDHTPFYLDGKPHTIISFLKENTSFPLYTWRMHHRDGLNHEKGDSMGYYDPEEVNATASLIFNITRYYTINPDCWFSNLSFSAFDSPNDGDTLIDSLRVNFSIDSILPSDKVMVNVSFCDEDDTPVLWTINNYTITSLTGVTHNLTCNFSLPVNIDQGFFKLHLCLYNSTGRINKIVNISNDVPNEIQASDSFHLYHPFGNPTPGNLSHSTEDIIRGSYFTANEYGTARNITAYVQANTSGTSVHSVCMIYRKNDSKLIGRTVEILPATGPTPRWRLYNFTTPYPVLEENTEYVLVCWSDGLCNLYYDHIPYTTRGRYDSQTYGVPPDPAVFTPDTSFYSIYCGYRNDTNPPWVTNVTEDPHIVGFGGDVTISADVVDNESGVKNVTVIIGYPGGKAENKTMTLVSGDTYQYVFNNTWLVGQYNYSIWTVDNYNNSINRSVRSHFHVSAEATISIATLQDSYSGSQYLNITDPPNPPENYTLVDRGLTWDEYYNADTGQNVLEVSTGPINYPEENGTWTPINNSISQLASNHPAYVYGYRNGNDRGLFGAYFKSNAQNDWPVAFTYNKSNDPMIHAVRSKLVGIGYVDPQSNWAYQYLQNVQSSQGQINENSITYEDVFTGTDVTWSYGNIGLKEEILLSNTTKTVLQNHPPSMYGLNNESSYLVFITKLDYQGLNLYNGSGLLDGNVTISDAGVDFRDVIGQFKCALPLGDAFELNNESVRQKLTYRIVHLNGNTYLLSGLKVSKLNTMIFPVVIDPTLSVNSLSNDGYISSSSTTYSTAWGASSGTVDSSATYLSIGQKKAGFPTSTYYIYRGFVLFNTSSLPSNAYLDSAILSLYKKDDYSTTDFLLTIQNGQPTYPHNPLQGGDYDKMHYSGNGGSLSTANYVNGRNNITLSNLSWINETGITKLCLRSSRDINGTTPTGNEYVNVYSTNAPNAGYVPKLIITYRNQSKIKNTGSTNIKGYLLIQVQFYNTSQSKWLVDNDTINETSARTISNGHQLALDTIFNGHVRASNLQHGAGTYRVYAAFRDPEDNILRANDDTELVAWWLFSKT